MSSKQFLLLILSLSLLSQAQATSNSIFTHQHTSPFLIENKTSPHDSIPLWDTAPLYNKPGIPNEEEWYNNNSGATKVTVPMLYPFLLDDEEQRPAVLICPGGGYSHLAMKKEGFDVARWFNEQGFHAFVLKYRLPNPKASDKQSLVALSDSKRALQLMHENASKWKIDTSRIGIMGFSAGGHLAASTSTLKVEEIDDVFPDFSILIYPVISMRKQLTHMGSRKNLLGQYPDAESIALFSTERQINQNTPITFLVHSSDDEVVIPENSILYYQSLLQKGIDAELHLYQYGGHGYGMLPDKGYLSTWPGRLADWLKRNLLNSN